jgi:hypothetical protein
MYIFLFVLLLYIYWPVPDDLGSVPNWWSLISLYQYSVNHVSCRDICSLFWFTMLAQHETNDVILYIHSVHKHRRNSFQRQNYKMRLKQRSLNWINSMQIKKILFTNVFFPLIIMLVKYVSIDGISQAFVPFRFVDVIVITDHELFWN